jgi:hypothetical protein
MPRGKFTGQAEAQRSVDQNDAFLPHRLHVKKMPFNRSFLHGPLGIPAFNLVERYSLPSTTPCL